MAEPEKIGDILASERVAAPRKRKQKLELLKVNWRYVAGERAGEHSRPSRLVRGTLTVAAESPPWAAELSMRSDEIRRQAEKMLGSGSVRKVRVESRSGAAVQGAGGRADIVDEEPLRTGEDVGGELGRELERLEDARLRESLTRLVKISRASRQSKQDHG